jgi:hypothetical protein
MPPRNHFADGIDAFVELYSEMSDASDRSVAIVGAALLDDTLGFALTYRFIALEKSWTDRLFDGADAPLGTLSAKVRMGYALRLFGSTTCADLDRVRWIRNQFAHSARRKLFTETAISDRCMQLTTPMTIPPGLGEPFPLESARSRYLATCRHIALQMTGEINKSPPSRPSISSRLP